VEGIEAHTGKEVSQKPDKKRFRKAAARQKKMAK